MAAMTRPQADAFLSEYIGDLLALHKPDEDEFDIIGQILGVFRIALQDKEQGRQPTAKMLELYADSLELAKKMLRVLFKEEQEALAGWIEYNRPQNATQGLAAILGYSIEEFRSQLGLNKAK
jgi:hypothetical protein